MSKSKNSNLIDAKRNKNDEFYTQWEDIEKEVILYRDNFRDKVVYLNCDDERSNFFKFFAHVFDSFGLMKVISTHYDTDRPTYKIELTRENFRVYANPDGSFNEGAIDGLKIPLIGNGDFRSAECVELLKEADIVVTNPPFSLFREYVAQLIEHEKKFLIIGNPNAITYKEIFPVIKENQMWLGNKSMGTDMLFNVTEEFAKELVKTKKEGSAYKIVDGIVKGRAQAIWFTNMEIPKRKYLLGMYERYYDDITKYPKYDNYDAINVDKVSDIPEDYYGVMGVPITFVDKYNPNQFEIITMSTMSGVSANFWTLIGGSPKYARIFIKRKVDENANSQKFGNIGWFTNMEIPKRECLLDMHSRYYDDVTKYPKYDNYDAINVDRVSDIPEDYMGEMGVPITFLDKYNPNQFEILGLGNSRNNFTPSKIYNSDDVVEKYKGAVLNDVLNFRTPDKPHKGSYHKMRDGFYIWAPYARVIIRRKVNENANNITEK